MVELVDQFETGLHEFPGALHQLDEVALGHLVGSLLRIMGAQRTWLRWPRPMHSIVGQSRSRRQPAHPGGLPSTRVGSIPPWCIG